MNKLPAKQIYLLTIIIVGIIALSVYSTYALFTFESSTSNIVSIHTPTSLQISENIYEYQQLTVEPNSVTTTDISVYNTFEYDVCYSIWYKVIGKEDIKNKVQIFQKNNDALTTSGILTGLKNIKVTIVIVNDNEEPVKINLGTLGEQLTKESCSLNLTKDKQMISSTYNNLENLSEKLLSKIYEINNIEENYLTYKDYNEVLTYKENDKIYLSDKFKYKEEIFTLEELSKELTIKKIVEENYLESHEMYLCKENNSCQILYKIKEIKIEEKKSNENEIEIYYHITIQDKMIGYSSGINGIRKINKKDYIFYGDNPNNYIYYNCENSDDVKTCELWRIVGLYYNEETEKYNVKIIKNDSIGKYQYDDTEDELLTWENSKLYKYLEEEYKLINNYDIYIDDYKQSIETLKSLEEEIKQEENKLETKINLLNLSDYINASTCKIDKIEDLNDECIRKTWLYNIEIGQSWTSTKKEEPEIIIETIEPEIETETEENLETEVELPPEENPTEETQTEETEEEMITEIKTIINYNYSVGEKVTETKTTELLDVRPVIYLKSRMILVSGDGSFETPYIIK